MNKIFLTLQNRFLIRDKPLLSPSPNGLSPQTLTVRKQNGKKFNEKNKTLTF